MRYPNSNLSTRVVFSTLIWARAGVAKSNRRLAAGHSGAIVQCRKAS